MTRGSHRGSWTWDELFSSLVGRSKTPDRMINLLLAFIDWQKVANAADAEILRVPDIGRKSLETIRKTLAFHGYKAEPGETRKEKIQNELLLQIIIDLFAPTDGHADGCLTKSGGPCQCGWSTTQVRYNFALKAAKELASEHDYKNDFRIPVYLAKPDGLEQHRLIREELDRLKEEDPDA